MLREKLAGICGEHLQRMLGGKLEVDVREKIKGLIREKLRETL